MTNKPTPTSKAIQMGCNQTYFEVLCEDGSIWIRHGSEGAFYWECILEAHQELEAKEPTKEKFSDEVQEAIEFVKAGIDIVSVANENHIWGLDTRKHFKRLVTKTEELIKAIENDK